MLKEPSATTNWSAGSWAENISYDVSGHMSATLQQFGTNTLAYYQRLIYADIIGFMIEINNVNQQHPLGHLMNLLSRDHVNSGFGLTGAKNKEIGTKNAIGLGYDFRETGTFGNTNMVVTHTLSTHVQNQGEGGYIAGIAYEDLNNNEFYDIGEGINVTWRVIHNGIFWAWDSTSVQNFGVISEWEPSNGRYQIGPGAPGYSFGDEVVEINNNNVWIEWYFSPGFSLTDDATPSLVADLYEGGSGNDTVATATDLGVFNATVPDRRTSTLSIHNNTDLDFFRFQVGDGVAHTNILVSFAHSQGDINAYLYRQNTDGSYSLMLSSTSTDDDEMFDTDLGSGTYVLVAVGVNGATNFYSLTLDVQVEPPFYADLGSYGLWQWTSQTNWKQLTPADPEALEVGPNGDLFADLGGYGSWLWKDSRWTLLTTANPENLVSPRDGELHADFGPAGWWRWFNNSWTQKRLRTLVPLRVQGISYRPRAPLFLLGF